MFTLAVLKKVGPWLLAAAALVFAFWFVYDLGWDARDAKVQKELAAQRAQDLETFKTNTATAARLNAETALQITSERDRQLSIAEQLQAHLNTQLKGSPHAKSPLLGSCVLDAESVRLLNRARAAAELPAGSPAVRADAEVEAPAAPDWAPIVFGADFAANDLEVIQLYKDLAIRHDGLVDWVNDQLKASGAKR